MSLCDPSKKTVQFQFAGTSSPNPSSASILPPSGVTHHHTSSKIIISAAFVAVSAPQTGWLSIRHGTIQREGSFSGASHPAAYSACGEDESRPSRRCLSAAHSPVATSISFRPPNLLAERWSEAAPLVKEIVYAADDLHIAIGASWWEEAIPSADLLVIRGFHLIKCRVVHHRPPQQR
jgi:hypothetical protein